MTWLLFVLFSTGDVELITLHSQAACENAGRSVARLSMQEGFGAVYWCEEVSDE